LLLVSVAQFSRITPKQALFRQKTLWDFYSRLFKPDKNSYYPTISTKTVKPNVRQNFHQ